jgi:alkyl hydroperoxide reductase subunit D
MQELANPGLPKLDFELACLAASAIAGCEACVRAHERSVREHGASPEMIQDAVRIAAVIHGVAVALGHPAEPQPVTAALASHG